MKTALVLAATLAALPHTAWPQAAPPEKAAPRTAQESGQESARLPSFKDDLDQTVRWLRGQQDRVTGAYGGVPETALTLIALAECPRHYRRADGPFVAAALDWLVGRQEPDGRVADPGADEALRARQTELAAEALGHFTADSEPVRKAWVAALKTEPDGGALDELEVDGDAAPEALAARGAELLARRRADGSWDGDVAATAAAAVKLARIEAALARHRPKRPAREASALPEFAPADAERGLEAARRGARFLLAAQVEPGRWGVPGHADPGITAMVLGALETLPEPRSPELSQAIDAGLAWLVSLQNEDGSIHAGQLPNYVTSASILALVRSGREEYAPVVARAREFLRALQADEGEGYSEGDRYYGGIGYGGDERPDLSNLQMALEALAASGLESGDPTYAKALKFLERCQNRSESNDVRIVDGDVVITSGNDGGAGYMPGDSKAGFVELSDGTKIPRSYGSMTYALLKCFVFAGLERDDPRVEAAWRWCRQHYTLDVNPGFTGSGDPSAAYQGLFYYLNTMAVALDLYGEETVVDGSGQEHPWRAELTGRLVSMQSRIDGSWTNHNAPRWWEGNPVLATSYALLALDAARP